MLVTLNTWNVPKALFEHFMNEQVLIKTGYILKKRIKLN